MRSALPRLISAVLAALWLLSGCGGGGGGGGSSSSGPPIVVPPQALTINTDVMLPGTLQGKSYSVTLTASGGQPAYHWSIAPRADTALFVTGMSIDANTGVLSGTANFLGQASFIATVTDAASPPHTATKTFYLTASLPLTVPASQTVTLMQYSDSQPVVMLNITGGVQPFTITIPPGCLPAGVKQNPQQVSSYTFYTLITGIPLAIGSFQCAVTVQDSYSPPEVGTHLLTLNVTRASLRLANSLPTQLTVGVPFSGRLVATGGMTPYTFAITSGSLPAGLSLDSSTGRVSGTPTTVSFYPFSATVTDSSSPAGKAYAYLNCSVRPRLGRNDSPATATPFPMRPFTASISPYIDPTNGTPAPGDNDYYKLQSLGGTTVHVGVSAVGNDILDTVIEIVDGNGQPLTTCRQPGDNSTAFTSVCVNDDISSSWVDSALDLQVPGATNLAQTFYVHVLDWRGDARPDMIYTLSASGLVAPLAIDTSRVHAAWRGNTYSADLISTNGTGTVTWSLDSGSLPPGITLGSNGIFGGTPTTNGTYEFTVRATDSATPPQTATASLSIVVAEPLVFTSPAVWPDACQYRFYSFALQTAGGAPPVHFSGYYSTSPLWPEIREGMTPDRLWYDGVFSGIPTFTGTFTAKVSALDATGPQPVSQSVTLTVKACP